MSLDTRMERASHAKHQLTAILQGGFRVPLIVFLGGVNLTLIQWIMVRELTMLLLGTELVVLLVSASYFVGLSLGYLLSGRINKRWLPTLAAVTLILHLALPMIVRLLSGWLYSQNVFWIAFVILPLVMPFTVSAFYSILLPLYIDSGEGQLTALYTGELAGAALGIVILLSISILGLTTLYVVYTVILLAILISLRLAWKWLLPLAFLAALWLVALPSLDNRSNAYWFGQVFALTEPTTVFSGYSPYQKVDIIQDGDGNRYLFLNGLIDYGTDTWNRLNVVLGEIPARLVKPKKMVTVGSGSMALEGLVAPYAGHITTVELDPAVLNASRLYFADVNQVDTLPNWSYIIDDAKHFFANTNDQYDLVTMNVPAPLTGQTATLYSSSFYAAVKAKLSHNGVLAVSLTRPLKANIMVARRIAAGVMVNFNHVIAVTPDSVGLTFLFASDNPAFTSTDVEVLLKESGETSYSIMDERALAVFVGNAPPITPDDLGIAVEESFRRIRGLMQPW